MAYQEKKGAILAVGGSREINQQASLLGDAGYTILNAADQPRALQLLNTAKNIELILLSDQDNGVVGNETLSAIRHLESCRDIPVLFSGDHSFSDYNWSETDAIDYIPDSLKPCEFINRAVTLITLRRKNQQLKECTAQLELQKSIKDKLFSIILNDLRNPFSSLQVIHTMIQKSIKQNNMELVESLMLHMESTIDGGNKMLENLMQWAGYHTEKIAFHPTENSLIYIIEDVVEHLKPLATTKEIQIKEAIPADISIFTDANYLATVLRNLLTNAIKYSHQSGIVEISAYLQDDAVCINIEDNGIGMDKATCEKLFYLNSQLESQPGTFGEEGTGLGLILSREFMEKMNGSISVISSPGNGSNFSINLPATIPKNID
jgi:two-component system, sensor histidine kinase and response regulator